MNLKECMKTLVDELNTHKEHLAAANTENGGMPVLSNSGGMCCRLHMDKDGNVSSENVAVTVEFCLRP